MKYSIVKLQQVNNAIDRRLDPEYWDPEVLKVEQKLDGEKLSTFIQDGYRVVYENTKIIEKKIGEREHLPYFVQASDIENFYINMDTVDCVSENDWNAYPKGRINKGELLIEVKGNVKKVAIVTDDIPCKTLISGTLYKASIKNINKYHVLNFLSCKYGQKLKERLVCNIATPYINKESLYNIKIPLMSNEFQKKIEKCYIFAFKIVQKSKESYSDSLITLLSLLDVLNWTPKHKLWSVKNYSDVKDANRLDAEYFQPKYDEIMNILNKNGYTRLIDNFNIVRNSGLEYHEDGKIGVIKTKQIKDKFIDFNVESKTNLYEDNVIVKNKDVLFASMGVGSLGKTNIYYNFENNNEFIIDSTLKIFRKKINGSISPELLEAYLHTQIAQELIYQNVVGSSGIISVYESYLQELPIPIINNSVEQKIVENIKTAHLLYYQSKQLLEIAKRGVEIAIEQDEDIATNWINQELQKIGVEL